jgi:hypothetical protein
MNCSRSLWRQHASSFPIIRGWIRRTNMRGGRNTERRVDRVRLWLTIRLIVKRSNSVAYVTCGQRVIWWTATFAPKSRTCNPSLRWIARKWAKHPCAVPHLTFNYIPMCRQGPPHPWLLYGIIREVICLRFFRYLKIRKGIWSRIAFRYLGNALCLVSLYGLF